MSTRAPLVLRQPPHLPIRLIAALAALAGAAAIGAAQIAAPLTGPALVAGLAVAPILLVLDGRWLVLATVAATLFSRLAVYAGGPTLLNYVHYGLLLLLVLRLALQPLVAADTRREPSVPQLALLAFTGLVGVSALANGWQGLRPVLFWLAIVEPFVLLAATAELSPDSRRRMRRLLIAMAAAQLPFALNQYLRYGYADPVRGTLFGLAGGAHVVAAIGVIGSALLVAGLRTGRGSFRALRRGLAVALFLIGAFSDAKQVYAALAVAVVLLLPAMTRARRSALIWTLLGGTLAVVAAISFLPRQLMENLTDVELIQGYVEEKLVNVELAIDELGVAGSFFGAGPGNGLSRVALTSVEGYGAVPRIVIGEVPAAMATRALAEFQFTGESSAESPLSSWLGIYTDVGLLGLVAYLALCVWAWRSLKGAEPAYRLAGQLLLLMTVVLGLVFTWLEEPAFVTFLAAAIGAVPRLHDRQAETGVPCAS